MPRTTEAHSSIRTSLRIARLPDPNIRSSYPFRPSINGVKPDFVEHGGNLKAVMRMADETTHRGLGVVFRTVDLRANAFREEIGTSFAAPAVAHRAAAASPRALTRLCNPFRRALLGTHMPIGPTRQSPC